MQKLVKGLIIGNGLLGIMALVLCLTSNIFDYGGHGILVFILCLVPLMLSGLSIAKILPFTRKWAGISTASWLITGMKTSGGDNFQGVMVLAFFAMILSLVLIIFPEKPQPKVVADQ